MANKEGSFDTFFPVDRTRGKKAKMHCAQCPVKYECLDFAVRNRIRDGVWGGRTDAERETLRRKWTRGHDEFVQEIEQGVTEMSYMLIDA